MGVPVYSCDVHFLSREFTMKSAHHMNKHFLSREFTMNEYCVKPRFCTATLHWAGDYLCLWEDFFMKQYAPGAGSITLSIFWPTVYDQRIHRVQRKPTPQLMTNIINKSVCSSLQRNCVIPSAIQTTLGLLICSEGRSVPWNVACVPRAIRDICICVFDFHKYTDTNRYGSAHGPSYYSWIKSL